MDTDQVKLDPAKLQYWKRRKLFRLMRKFSPILILMVLLTGLAVNYLANLPRERHARDASYPERVKLGLVLFSEAVQLALNAEHEDPFTKLPKAELYIKGKRLDKLNENLPESGRIDQKAKFKYRGVEDDVVVRYRGDSINHWALPHKSWRIAADGDNRIDKMSEINLNVPRVDNQISNWLGYKMARQFDGLIVPDSELVHFRLNRQYDGVRLLLEQPNLEFLEKRFLPPGKIYTGDIDSLNIYGGVPRKQLYLDAAAWAILSGSPDITNREILPLLRMLGQEHNPYNFYYKLGNYLDVPAILNYIAMLEIVGSVHVDSTHNGKFYYNNLNGRFTPIVWDTVAYFWHDQHGFDLSPNQLFRVILSNPELREQKDRIIWDKINGELSVDNLHRDIDEIVAIAKNDIRAFDLKIHANDKGIEYISNPEWEEAISKLKGTIVARHGRIKERLAQTDIGYRVIPQSDPREFVLAIEVKSPAGIHFEHLSLEANGLQTLEAERVGIDDLQRPIKKAVEGLRVVATNGQMKLVLNDHLFSKRKFVAGEGLNVVPALYQYRLKFDQAPKGLPSISLAVSNYLTKQALQPNLNPELQLPSEVKANAVWWSPEDLLAIEEINLSGEVILTESLVVDRFQKLIIAPGTRVKMGPRVSIIIDGGEMVAIGSPDRKIVFEPQIVGKPWAGIAAVNNGKINLAHADLRGGSSSQHNFARFDGSLAFHYAKGEVANVNIDTQLSTLYSNLNLSNSVFSTVHDYPIIVQYGDLIEKDNQYLKIPATHKLSYAEQTAEGTAPRLEREFKYTFMNYDPNKENPLLLSEELRQALAKNINTPGLWKIPEIVGNQYYVDEAAKDFLFRDVYFDTKDRLNHRYDVAYRYRNRYPSVKSYRYHNKNYARMAYWPYRLEFQSKTFRDPLGDGLSELVESRFEFRKESLPFSDQYIPPIAPWDESYFIPMMKSGYFDGMLTTAAKSIVDFYKDKVEPDRELEFDPSVVLVTTRYRQHFNIKTPWGGGPNPEQSNIISLDHARIYRAEPYLQFLEARHLGNDTYPEPEVDAEIVEIELEFERNVSDKLDKAIDEAKVQGNLAEQDKLIKTREAFMSDLTSIMKVVSKSFAERGVIVSANPKSKYVQAMDLVEGQLE